jgi:hypothetical protein
MSTEIVDNSGIECISRIRLPFCDPNFRQPRFAAAVTIAAPNSGRMASSFRGEAGMADGKKKKFDLGKSGTITCHVSGDGKRLLIDFDVDQQGLTKTGVNGLIDALKDIREKMVR